MVGAGQLEMAAAAAATLSEPAAGMQAAVEESAFTAPCLLPAPGSGKLLVLEASLERSSSYFSDKAHTGARPTTTLSGRIASISSAAASHSARQPVTADLDLKLCSCLHLSCQSAATGGQPVAASCSNIGAPLCDAAASYYHHPTITDASFHLSALSSQLLLGSTPSSSSRARIPISAGLYVPCAKIGSQGNGPSRAIVMVSLSALYISGNGAPCEM